MDYKDVNNYLTFYRNSGACANSVKNKRLLLSSVFSWLTKNHYIAENPMNQADMVKAEAKVKKPLTSKEIEQVFSACEKVNGLEKYRDLSMIKFMLDTGVRVSELCNIKLKDVDFNDKSVIVKGKGNKYREVYFSDACVVRLQEYLNQRPDLQGHYYDLNTPLFQSKRGGALTPAGVQAMLKRLRADSGVMRLHPHLFRATAFSHYAEKGVPMPVIQKMAGHESLNTTAIYVKLSNSSVKRYVEMAN